jgi:single-stranded DNA-binding protein
VAKGTQVYVEGEFMVSNYTDANGQKKFSTEVKIETIQFLSKFEKSQTSSNESFNDGDNFDDGEPPF